MGRKFSDIAVDDQPKGVVDKLHLPLDVSATILGRVRDEAEPMSC
jgi:hypothetical protein